MKENNIKNEESEMIGQLTLMILNCIKVGYDLALHHLQNTMDSNRSNAELICKEHSKSVEKLMKEMFVKFKGDKTCH